MNGYLDNDQGKIVLCKKTLKNLRRLKGFSQEAMADACQSLRLRVSISSIKRAETGHPVNYRTARALANFFSLDVADIMTDDAALSGLVHSKPIYHNKMCLLFVSVFPISGCAPLLICENIGQSYGGRVMQRFDHYLVIRFTGESSDTPADSIAARGVAAAFDIEQRLMEFTEGELYYRGYLWAVENPPDSEDRYESLSALADNPALFAPAALDSSHSRCPRHIIISHDIKKSTDQQFCFRRIAKSGNSMIDSLNQGHWLIVGRTNT